MPPSACWPAAPLAGRHNAQGTSLRSWAPAATRNRAFVAPPNQPCVAGCCATQVTARSRDERQKVARASRARPHGHHNRRALTASPWPGLRTATAASCSPPRRRPAHRTPPRRARPTLCVNGQLRPSPKQFKSIVPGDPAVTSGRGLFPRHLLPALRTSCGLRAAGRAGSRRGASRWA